MKIVLLHGFNVRDGGKGSIDKLEPFLKKEFPSIKRRIRNPQNKRKPIHLITQVLLGLRYRSSVKENILFVTCPSSN